MKGGGSILREVTLRGGGRLGAGTSPERLAQVWLFIVAPLIGSGLAGYLFKSGLLAADDVVPDRGGGGRTEVAPGASAPRKKK